MKKLRSSFSYMLREIDTYEFPRLKLYPLRRGTSRQGSNPSAARDNEWLAEVRFLGVVDLFKRHPVLPSGISRQGVRLQIALGAAEVLLYMYEGLEVQVGRVQGQKLNL